jgi:uncharacterized protein
MRPVILVFAKAPVPGRVKTRLSPPLSPEEAAALHEEMVRCVLRNLNRLSVPVDLELHTDIPTDAWLELKVARKLQIEGDLGIKMRSALETALTAGHPQAMVIGSDSPDLPPGHLEALLASSADVSIGPAEDGGYYAIACRRTHPAMFDQVQWSQAATLAATAGALLRCRLSLQIGSPWYDIDTIEDLNRWRPGGTWPSC